MGMNWLITGGCGFLGVNLIANLMMDGEDAHHIIVLDDLGVGTRDDLSAVCTFKEIKANQVADEGAVNLVVGSILDADLVLELTKNIDVIVHFAANTGVQPSISNPRLDMQMNVIGTFNLLEAARQNDVTRFVFASSGAPAGEVDPPIHEEVAPHPVSPYGASKLAGEGYCSAYSKSFGLDTVCLRFGNVYGPRSGHKASVVAKFINNALNGRVIEIYGDGSQTRDFIYVDDLIRAVRLAAKVPNIGGETFQIATQSETTVRDLLDQLVDAFSNANVSVPEVVYTERLAGDVMRNYSDTSKAGRMLGWQAEVHLKKGLETTLQWFLDSSDTTN